jgi:hypothetical protein
MRDKAPSTESDIDISIEPLDIQARRKTAILREYGYEQRGSGLYAVKQGPDKEEVWSLVAKMHVDVTTKRHIYTVPDHITEKPKEQGVVLVARFAPLHNRQITQSLEIHRSDMRARQPKFFEQIQVAKPPHKRKEADFIDALESMAMGADLEHRYNATGLVRIDDKLVFLHPANGALTERGINDLHKVQFGMKHEQILSRIHYGWERASLPDERISDYQTLLQILNIAPGSTGYGDVLLGILGFAPMSQLCDTGGVHGIIHGVTGSFKSASSRLPLQGYAGVAGRQETSTFNLADGKTTVASMLQIEYFLSGMFIHADDALKGRNISEKEIKKFYSDMSLRGRLAATRQGYDRSTWSQGDMGFAVAHYPRSSSVVTVEILPSSDDHSSELARYIVVSLDGPDCVDTVLLTALQDTTAAARINHATAAYIQWLLSHMDELLYHLVEREEVYREQGVHTRTPTSYAKLETGICALLQYGVSIGAHTEADAAKMLDESRARLVHVAVRQKAMMGIDERTAQANDTIHIFYELLRKALRERVLFASDAAFRPIEEYSSTGNTHTIIGYRPQPPAFTTDTSDDLTGLRPGEQPDVYGWKWTENARVYEPGPNGIEAGVLKWEAGEPVTLQMYVKDFKETIYPAMKKLANSQEIPLPGLSEMVSKLKEKDKLASTSPTNLHGRNSRKARVYVLDMTPEPEVDEPPTQPPMGEPPAQPEAPSQGETTTPPPNTAQSFLDAIQVQGCELSINEQDQLWMIHNATDEQHALFAAHIAALSNEQQMCLVKLVQGNVAPAPRQESNAIGEQQQDEQRTPRQDTEQKPKWTGGVKKAYRSIPTAFADTESGLILFGDEARQAGARPRLSAILAALPEECERVYLTGGRPGDGSADGLYTWLREPAVGEIWQTGKLHIDADLPVLSLSHREHRKRKIDIRRAAAWFGEGSYSPYVARDALNTLDRLLKETFDSAARCLTTPGSTGLDLWDRSRVCDYPVLSQDYQALLEENTPYTPRAIRDVIKSTAGQGRIELCPYPGRETLPGFAYVDGYFMYAALGKGLGFGPAEHSRIPTFEPNRRGRYRIRFTVPPGWQHVGIFSVKRESRDGWFHPGEQHQGQTFETWADATEIRLALNPPRGMSPWHIEYLECFLLQSASKGHPWPLDVWCEKLIALRQRIATEPGIPEPVRALLLAAARAILLHGVGSFARSMRDELVIVYPQNAADIAALPADCEPEQHDDGTWTYVRPAKLSPYSAKMMHPELPSAIWARCRTHLLYSAKKQGRGEIVSETGALLMPRDWLVAFRTDAIYATSDPGWPDDKVPGQFRLKGILPGPVKQPGTYGEPATARDYQLLNDLRDRSEQHLKRNGGKQG